MKKHRFYNLKNIRTSDTAVAFVIEAQEHMRKHGFNVKALMDHIEIIGLNAKGKGTNDKSLALL